MGLSYQQREKSVCLIPPGTGTVVVEVGDVNDVPPRFFQPQWTLDVPEGLPTDHVLAILTVGDQDVTNNFFFRVSQVLPFQTKRCLTIIYKGPFSC